MPNVGHLRKTKNRATFPKIENERKKKDISSERHWGGGDRGLARCISRPFVLQPRS